MGGSLVLLVTAWVVSDNAPGSATSVWPAVFVVFWLIYAGAGVALLDAQTLADDDARAYALAATLSHLLPFTLVVWGVTAWLEGTAYAHLARWCWWTVAGCAVVIVLATLYRLRRRPRA